MTWALSGLWTIPSSRIRMSSLTETELDEGNLSHEVPLEADEADAAEQERELSLDEDDYR